jgi:hypothetical protein
MYHFQVEEFFKSFELGDLLWNKQRPINQDVKSAILDNIISKDALNGHRLINMIITIATVNGNDPKVIDGQHRLAALENMDGDDQFIVIAIDFMDENSRFLEFININNNTSLPDLYKSITDFDSFCKNTAEITTEALAREYPALLSKHDRNYYLHKPTIEEQLFKAFQTNNVPMEDMYLITDQILEYTKSTVLFPRIKCSPVYNKYQRLVNNRTCLAQTSASNKYRQCRNAPKTNGYCGMHKAQKHPFKPIHLRSKRFSEVDPSMMFIMDLDWIMHIVNHRYPLY